MLLSLLLAGQGLAAFAPGSCPEHDKAGADHDRHGALDHLQVEAEISSAGHAEDGGDGACCDPGAEDHCSFSPCLNPLAATSFATATVPVVAPTSIDYRSPVSSEYRLPIYRPPRLRS